jgi:hypothetical protein
MSHQLFVVIVTKPIFIYVCDVLLTLKDSKKIQNFVTRSLILTAARHKVSKEGVNGMIDTLFGTIITSPVPKDFLV